MKGKYVLIEDKQEQFINEQSKNFKFSRFVRAKLNEYIKLNKIVKEAI